MNERSQEELTRRLRRFVFWDRFVMVSLLLIALCSGSWELMHQRSRIKDLEQKENLLEAKLEQGLIPRNQVSGQGELVGLLDRTPAEREWGILMFADEIGNALRATDKLEDVLPCPIPKDHLAVLLVNCNHADGVGIYNGGLSARVMIELGVPVEPIRFKLENRQSLGAMDGTGKIQNSDESFQWTKADFEFPKNQWSRFRLNEPARVFQWNGSIVKGLDFQTSLLKRWDPSESNVGWSRVTLRSNGLPQGLNFLTELHQLQKNGVVRIYEFRLIDGDGQASGAVERKLVGWLRVSLKINDEP